MFFKEWAARILAEELRRKSDVGAIVAKLREVEGKIAFYPCSRYTRQLLKEIRQRDPALLQKVLGCFDRSPQATSEPGIRVYGLSQLDALAGGLALLVVASSTYHSRQLREVQEATRYAGPILKTSFFDYSMPPGSPDSILAGIERVCGKLRDTKSRMIYTTSWLSRILNDEDITSLFESENVIPEFDGDCVNFKGHVIRGISNSELQKELFADVYKMKHVGIAEGDVVLDVGAFRGETAIVFADAAGKTGKVYAFEPIKASYELMQRNVSANGLTDIIEPVNMGCSSKTQTTAAVSVESGDPWNFISADDGSVPVRLTTIDEFVFGNGLQKVDFIKMDVEGFEMDALLGAREVLRKFRPKLAIALYHKSSDLLTIPELIASVGDYAMYVRCNMDGPYGLNLFCR